jgi:DNA-directed RNA polymerase specialized sigma24 family protein
MTAATQSESDAPPSPAPATLGDLLYSDSTKVRIPEADWVVLVEAIAEGRMRGMQELYERTGSLVYWLALRITHDHAMAEEVMLVVFQDIWTRARGYEATTGSVLSWIMNLTRSWAIQMRTNSDFTTTEVTQLLAEPVGTIEGRIKSALTKLRFALTGEGPP